MQHDRRTPDGGGPGGGGRSPDPTAEPLRENRAAGGKVRLITFQGEETECSTETG